MLLNKFKAANRPSWAEDIWKIAFSAGCIYNICSLVISFAFLYTASYWNFLLLTSLVTMALVWGLYFVFVCFVLSCLVVPSPSPVPPDSFLLPWFCFHFGYFGGGVWAETTLGQYGKMGKTSQSPLTGRLLTCASNGIKQAVWPSWSSTRKKPTKLWGCK